LAKRVKGLDAEAHAESTGRGGAAPSPEFSIKMHRAAGQVLLAACDIELLDREIPTGRGFNVRVSKQFYGGVGVGAKEVVEAMREATSLNLMGDRVVRLALSSGFGHPEAAMRIGSVLHMILVHI